MNITVGDGQVRLGASLPFVFIGGPCLIENEDHALIMAERIKTITDRLGIGFIYKSSYDKANRSSMASNRGVGIDRGLRILEKVRKQTGVPVLTDVHSPGEAAQAGAVVDVVQVPAFLCRQTDLLVAAANTGKPVNVKKGPFMAPWDMANVVDKLTGAGASQVMLTERGVSFGYNNLVVDMTAIFEMTERIGVPVVFDAGHSAQRPGGLGHASGGDRNLIPVLARAAVAVGVAAVFLETHQDPAVAPCDGPNMWRLEDLEGLLASLKKIDAAVKGFS